jgi:hypothetical protein
MPWLKGTLAKYVKKNLSKISRAVKCSECRNIKLTSAVLPRFLGGLFPAVPNVHLFSNLYRVQTGSGAHSAFYLMRTGSDFAGNRAARAWSWPLNTHLVLKSRKVKLYIHSHICLHGVVLVKHRINFNFTFINIVRLNQSIRLIFEGHTVYM